MTEPGLFARIKLDDVRLDEAGELVEDAAWFEQTRLPILFHFPQISLAEYWALTVGEHRALVDFLTEKDLI